MAPYLRIENITRRFGSFTAVDDMTLDIERGEVFSLLGPSGSGKTTLLRMAGAMGGRATDVATAPSNRRNHIVCFRGRDRFGPQHSA